MWFETMVPAASEPSLANSEVQWEYPDPTAEPWCCGIAVVAIPNNLRENMPY
jgi:hypothetical protein